MTRVIFSNRFIRAFQRAVKRQKELDPIFEEKLSVFTQNPRDKLLGTHKLHGKLRHKLAFWVTPKLRVVFSHVDSTTVIFEDFGTHDQVYD
jgi:mRNA-degrading endonuclease YafQ of YafQ-DinJ toxin-antitoxin module